MSLTYETAYELSHYYGYNWNKDPQWHQAWFDNFAGLLYASFKNYDNELVRRAAMQYIADTKDKRLPPFGDLKAYMVKKLGAEQMRQAISASNCKLCSDGTRRLYIVVRIDEDQIVKREYVARCTCSRGALNTKADSYSKFVERLQSPKAYRYFGFSDRDPHSVELLEWYVTRWNQLKGRDEYPAGVNPCPFAGMPKDKIGEIMSKRKEQMRENGIEAQKRMFRALIAGNKNSHYHK